MGLSVLKSHTDPIKNYPNMAVAGNLAWNINILETLDDNELLKRYHLNQRGITTVAELH